MCIVFFIGGNMLEFKDVGFTYKDTNEKIVDNLSFSIDEGKFYSIIGSSGCGKSTLFRLICKLISPDTGSIIYNSIDVNMLKSYCAYMPQKDMLFLWRNIYQNLSLPLELRKMSKNEIKNRVEAILVKLGLDNYANAYPSSLSGGMRQRVAFARTLLTDNDLLLLDEPFSALDALSRLDMQDWLLKLLNDYKRTTVLITHDVEEAIYLSDEIFVVRDKPIRYLEKISVPKNTFIGRNDLDRPKLIELKHKLIAIIRGEE